MKTLQTQLTEMHEQIRKLGGTVPAAGGKCIERQLEECREEIAILKSQVYTFKESRRKSKTQELYEALGLTPEQAKIAASLERGVVTGNVNRIFEAGLAMGMSVTEARLFANPKLTLEEAFKNDHSN